MKKLVNPMPAGGAPVFGTETLVETMSEETWTAIQAIFGTLTPSDFGGGLYTNNNIVLTGGVPTSVGGGDFDITAGVAYFPDAAGAGAGIIAAFPAVSSFTPGFLGHTRIELLAPVTEQKTFFDSGTKDYAVTYSAAISATATVADTDAVTGYITAGTSRFPSLQWMLDAIIGNAASPLGDIMMRKYEIGTWDMDANISHTETVAAGGNVVKAKIISVSCIIREDSTTGRKQFDLTTGDNSVQSGGYPAHGWVEIDENDGDNGFDIVLHRVASGFFDSTDFDGTVDSRGYIIVHYDNS